MIQEVALLTPIMIVNKLYCRRDNKAIEDDI